MSDIIYQYDGKVLQYTIVMFQGSKQILRRSLTERAVKTKTAFDTAVAFTELNPGLVSHDDPRVCYPGL